MTKELDLADIQGNVIRGYGRFGFPKARYLFLRVDDGHRGRKFVGAVTERVTTSVNWGESPGKVPKPKATTNIGFTFKGLMALEVPAATLIGFPEEYMMGMKRRRDILGDDGPSAPENWDKIWEEEVHVWISINGETVEDVEERYAWLQTLIDASDGGVTLLTGHRGDDGQEDLPYQEASVLYDADGNAKPTEHFGYTDGIGDPVFEGQPGPAYRVKGRGKVNRDGSWSPLATGEFLLGHPDEAEEYPPAPTPVAFARNGTFMVYRKLHENVGSFNAFLDEQAKNFPGGKELLAAKFSGRWRDNGLPIVKAPDHETKAAMDEKVAQLRARMADKTNPRDAAAAREEMDALLSDFTYDDDLDGAKCPFSGHLRRINPRGSLEYGQKGAYARPGALVDRRRLLRRGLPYGEAKDPSRDDGNHGIVFMAINASIKRQFEFVQQQWINYANDFKEGNDKEVLLGNHNACCPGKVVIQAKPGSGEPPYFVSKIPRLVETRGGEYFFVPGMTALRMIADGSVDPT